MNTIPSRREGMKFDRFGELPIEIRQEIWAWAAPEPAVVVQRFSICRIPRRRFFFVRKPPAILHACSESRKEYIELPKHPMKPDASLARRKSAHPVYKLISGGHYERPNRPIYFCAEIDSFWGLQYDAVGRSNPSNGGHFLWSGITQLSLAPTMRHLVLSERYDCCSCKIELLIRGFPKMETLTLLMLNYWGFGKPKCEAPEVNGELDWRVLRELDSPGTFPRGMVIENYRRDFEVCAGHLMILPERYRIPSVKFRFENQFVAAQKIVWPPQEPIEVEDD